MTLARRIDALEAKGAPDDDDKLTHWGPGFEHLPPTTKGALRRMLQDIHSSGAGRLPTVSRGATVRGHGDGRRDETQAGSCASLGSRG
jgi:hypothetical protein